MPYVTSIERLAMRKGLCKGIESLLRVRFGDEGLKLMPAIREIYEEEKLEAILKALETAANPDEVSVLARSLDASKAEERRMPFVTSIERVWYCRGLRESIESLLRVRFGDEGLKLMPEIREVYEEEKLLAILRALETAASPDEVRRLWSPGASSRN